MTILDIALVPTEYKALLQSTLNCLCLCTVQTLSCVEIRYSWRPDWWDLAGNEAL